MGSEMCIRDSVAGDDDGLSVVAVLHGDLRSAGRERAGGPLPVDEDVLRMAVDVDGQMGKLTGHARETMQREYDRLLRELNRLYTMNHAVKKYREAQHDRT